MTLISRGVPSAQGYTAAAAPRYILGSFVFTLGMLVILSKSVKNIDENYRFSIFLLIVTFAVIMSGVKTGSEWLSVRRSQTISLVECLNSSSLEALKPGGPCFVIATNIRNPVSDDILSKQLTNFNENRYQNNLIK